MFGNSVTLSLMTFSACVACPVTKDNRPRLGPVVNLAQSIRYYHVRHTDSPRPTGPPASGGRAATPRLRLVARGCRHRADQTALSGPRRAGTWARSETRRLLMRPHFFRMI